MHLTNRSNQVAPSAFFIYATQREAKGGRGYMATKHGYMQIDQSFKYVNSHDTLPSHSITSYFQDPANKLTCENIEKTTYYSLGSFIRFFKRRNHKFSSMI